MAGSSCQQHRKCSSFPEQAVANPKWSTTCIAELSRLIQKVYAFKTPHVKKQQGKSYIHSSNSGKACEQVVAAAAAAAAAHPAGRAVTGHR